MSRVRVEDLVLLHAHHTGQRCIDPQLEATVIVIHGQQAFGSDIN